MQDTVPLLIAEDNPDDMWLVNAALLKAGIPCSAHFATDGEEGVRWLKGTEPFNDRSKFPLPKLLITDLKMPRMDGFELIKWVRSQPEFAQMPIIVLSSSDLENDMDRAYSLGATCCVRKTTHFSKLIQYLRQTL